MSNAVSGSLPGDKGLSTPGLRPNYKTYRSPFGPKYKMTAFHPLTRRYKTNPNFHGIDLVKATRLGTTLGFWGAILGVAGFYALSDIPRFRNDVMIKLPFIGEHFIKEVPPEDNPF